MSDLPAAGRDSGVRTYSDVSISTVPLLDVHQPIIKTISGTHAVLGSEIWKKAIPYAESKPDNANFLDMDEEVSSGLAVSTRTTKHKREVNLNLWTKHEPATDQRTATKAGQSGTAKFTAWLRKKIAPEPPLKLQILRDIDDTCCGVGREVKDRHSTFAKEAAIDPRTQPDIVIDTFFPRCRGILGVADRDLVCISQHAIVVSDAMSCN
jgi:hypothetical protein